MDVCMTTRTNMKRKDIYIFSLEKATGQPGTEKGKRTCPWSAWIVTSITFMAAENKNALPLGVSRYFRIWGDVLRFGALPSWLLKTRVRYLWYFLRYLGQCFAIWCIAFMAAENKSALPLGVSNWYLGQFFAI